MLPAFDSPTKTSTKCFEWTQTFSYVIFSTLIYYSLDVPLGNEEFGEYSEIITNSVIKFYIHDKYYFLANRCKRC